MIHGLDHTALSVPDLEAALAFYCGVLGFEVESESEWWAGAKKVDRLVGLPDSAAKVVIVRLGGTRLELFEYRSPEPRRRDDAFRVCDHGLTHLCLRVSDIETEHARLAAAGMHFDEVPIDVGSSICVYGRDPFGNVIELKEYRDSDDAS